MADDTISYKKSSTSPADSSDNTNGKIRGGGNADAPASEIESEARTKEIGGRKGPDPTRYGDWEKNGRCIDF